MTYRTPPAYFPLPEAVEMRQAYGEDVREHLDDLMRACEDARRGYEAAAAKVEDDVLAATFRIYAAQRTEFGRELANLGATYGVDADEDGSIEGLFRRAWLAVKAAFTDGDPEEIIEAVLAIEQETLEEYEQALEAGLPPHVEGPVRSQYNKVAEAVTNLERLEERYDD